MTAPQTAELREARERSTDIVWDANWTTYRMDTVADIKPALLAVDMTRQDLEFYAKARHALPQLLDRIEKLEAVARQAEQFCTWLCEDSKKYPGTDAGDAARFLRIDLRKAIAAFDERSK